MHLCKFLRWKGYYGVDLFDEAALAEHYARNETPWECLKTCGNAGPDDFIVVPEDCVPDRACFVPSAKLIRKTT